MKRSSKILLAVVLSLLFFSGQAGAASDPAYVVLIDAGSSASRAYIYKFDLTDGVVIEDAIDQLDENLEIEPGLSSFGKKPEGVEDYFKELIEFVANTVPARYHDRTFLFIKATAGLRSIPTDQAEAVLDAAAAVVSKYAPHIRFERSFAEVISGAEEGTFGWMAANALVRAFSDASNELVGVIDLGGASFQVTSPLISNVNENKKGLVDEEHETTVAVGSAREVPVYTRSFLGMGAEKARIAMLSALIDVEKAGDSEGDITLNDPCLYKGKNQELELTPSSSSKPVKVQLVGAADGSSCKDAVSAFVKKTVAKASPLPEVNGHPFVVFSVYHIIRYFLNFDEHISLKELHGKCSELCSLDWDGVDKKYLSDYPEKKKKYVATYCFKCQYMASLLDDGFGFTPADVNKMRFTDQLGGEELSWTYGAAISEFLSVVRPSLPQSDDDGSSTIRNYFSGIFLISSFGLVAFFVYKMRSRKRFGDIHLYRADNELADVENQYSAASLSARKPRTL